MMLIVLCVCGQLAVNSIVGSEIDSLEAKKYCLFCDIEDFISVHFTESENKITAHMSIMQNESVHDSAVSIEREAFDAMDYYIRNFRLIIQDENFRRAFIEEFEVGWPIISQKDVQKAAKELKNRQLITTSCCVTAGCATGAYAAALITRKVRTEVDTIGIPVGCWVGNGGCTSVPVVITRKFYKINPLATAGGAAIGAGLGYAWARQQSRSHEVLSEALGRDIIAFDNAGYPITEDDVKYAKKTANELLLGTLGVAVGLAGSFVTAVGLFSPWADMQSEESWHETAVYVPIAIICSAELYLITNFFLKKGQSLDRMATIEKLKARRSFQ
ncbi:MAG: hypothetical protein JSV53_00835 [candidate division WOR-3 bacterium]|nr:MAG: hypothetical protein JSV53_00835 [candidate division WOR-3 bacterium]